MIPVFIWKSGQRFEKAKLDPVWSEINQSDGVIAIPLKVLASLFVIEETIEQIYYNNGSGEFKIEIEKNME